MAKATNQNGDYTWFTSNNIVATLLFFIFFLFVSSTSYIAIYINLSLFLTHSASSDGLLTNAHNFNCYIPTHVHRWSGSWMSTPISYKISDKFIQASMYVRIPVEVNNNLLLLFFFFILYCECMFAPFYYTL